MLHIFMMTGSTDTDIYTSFKSWDVRFSADSWTSVKDLRHKNSNVFIYGSKLLVTLLLACRITDKSRLLEW